MPEEVLSPVPAEAPAAFGDDTMSAFLSLYEEDSRTTTPRFRSKYPLRDLAFPTLNSGLVLIGGPENCGKSNDANGYYCGILDNTEDSRVIDFTLDDSRADRIRQLVAQRGQISMTDVQIAGALDPTKLPYQWREYAYKDIMYRYQNRLALIDGSGLKGKGGVIKHLVEYIGDVRSMYPTSPLWVNVDAFDDIQSGEQLESNESVSMISQALKRAAERFDCVICATKHLTKGSGRESGTDALRGYGSLKYDAKCILMCYNDVGENSDNAEICHYRDAPSKRVTLTPVFTVPIFVKQAGLSVVQTQMPEITLVIGEKGRVLEPNLGQYNRGSSPICAG
jgi:hypothetical protein